MLISFLITFFLLIQVSAYAFTSYKYSNGLGILNLTIIALAVGLREFGYDYFSYKNIYESITGGEGYSIESMTHLIANASHSLGAGFTGFLTAYSLLTFFLIYVISKMERIQLMMLLSVYCILLFSTGPLVTIRSSLSSLIFTIAVFLFFKKKVFQSLIALGLASLFHGAAVAAFAISLLVAIGRRLWKRKKRKALLIYFLLTSTLIHLSVKIPNVSSHIGSFTNNDFVLMLAARVDAYQHYVWLDFSSIVHYFQIASIALTIYCYSLLNPKIDPSLKVNEQGATHHQDSFSSDIINFSLIFGVVGFFYSNLVWGVRIIEFMAPLLAVMIVKFGNNKKHLPLLVLLSINLVNVFLGYMSSLNWKF